MDHPPTHLDELYAALADALAPCHPMVADAVLYIPQAASLDIANDLAREVMADAVEHVRAGHIQLAQEVTRAADAALALYTALYPEMRKRRAAPDEETA